MTDLAVQPGATVLARSSRFDSETELAAPVESWLRDVGASCIGHEVDAGVGYPDLVGGIGTLRALRNRKRQAGPVIDPIQLRLLDFCAQPRSEAELRQWADGALAALIRRAVEPLISAALLQEEQNVYRARRRPKDPFDTVVAVELKLHDVQRGLRQAASYRVFADQSFLALPAAKISPAVLGSARSAGIGLLAVHPSFAVVEVSPSPASLATPLRRRIASERTLAASMNSNQKAAGSARGRHA